MRNLDTYSAPAENSSEIVNSEKNYETKRFSLQEMGRKILTAEQEGQTQKSYESQLSDWFNSRLMRRWQELCDEKTFEKLVCKTLIYAQVAYQEGETLDCVGRDFMGDLQAGYTEEDEKKFRGALIDIAAERTGADIYTPDGQNEIFEFLKDRLVTNGYSYHAYNSADEDSIREFGLSPNRRAFDYEEALDVYQTIQKYDDDPMALGYLFENNNSSQGRVYYTPGPNWAYDYGKSCPEWFSYFVNRGRTDFDQTDPYTCRDYERARAQVEHYCDKLSQIKYGNEETGQIISSEGMTEEDRAKIVGFFDKMWEHYGNGTPKVALIPNMEVDIAAQEYMVDSMLGRLGNTASLDEKVNALLFLRTNGAFAHLTTTKTISPDRLKFVEMPIYFEAQGNVAQEAIESETATAETITPSEDENIDERMLSYERLDDLRYSYQWNFKKRPEYQDGEDPSEDGFRDYCKRFFTILDGLKNIKASNHYQLNEEGFEGSQKLQEALASALVETNATEQDIARINEILSYNTLPDFAKEFLSAEILYPPESYDYVDAFDFEHDVFDLKRNYVNKRFYTSRSRALSDAFELQGGEGVSKIVYHDLLKCAAGSGGQNLLNFLDFLENGEQLVAEVAKNHDVDERSSEERMVLYKMCDILGGLWYQDYKNQDTDRTLPTSLNEQVDLLYEKFHPTKRYSMSDRIIRSYGWTNGIRSADELRVKINDAHTTATEAGRELASDIVLQDRANKIPVGSFVKAMSARALDGVLENGILAKEFIVTGTMSDGTPFDTDFSMTLKSDNLRTALTHTTAAKLTKLRNSRLREPYNIFLVIEAEKIDPVLTWPERQDEGYDQNRYEVYTRDEFLDYEDDIELMNLAAERGMSIPDVGIRTGLPSSEISYIVATDIVSQIKAKWSVRENNFYIPIVDLDGKLVYTAEQYEQDRAEKAISS